MPNGKLTVELKTGFSALPIDQCVFRLKSKSGEILSEQIITPPTGGVSQTVTIDAPIKALSLDSGSKLQPYSVCDAELQTKHYYKMLFENVQIFDTINSQLCVEMVPLPSSIPNSESAITIIFDIPAHSLYKPSDEKKESVENAQAPPKKETMFSKKTNVLPAINIIGGVYIPETITVHLGKPSELAENVTVPFLEYVKNVASSEIYPTWPQESLKANIHAQISLVLNRIYTEWYRSKGYNYDITNSTAYDQYFVYGRNIFDSVSVIADEIFNTYLVKPYGVEPYYAEYCNGTTSTCAGMSQWGTVSLAKDGLSADEILRFYYPDIEITGTDNIRAITESYPGTPLKIGNTGEDVRIMQEQLNRIAINFPQIPLIRSVDGIYRQDTAASVSEFQKLYLLDQTGIVDKGTWYRISYAYTAVKRLAELTSEGQRAAYNQQSYPGYVLRRGVKGSEVQEIQFYLTKISVFVQSVPKVRIDGIYWEATESAVSSFQETYRLPITGEVNEPTWNKIVDVYNGTLENAPAPDYIRELLPYPGKPVKFGSKGGSVGYIQELLNTINNVFVTIPTLVPDEIYGAGTKYAVSVFQTIFGLPSTGITDEGTWNLLGEIYISVASQCIFSNPSASGTVAYPGTALSRGSSGNNVSYVQNKLNVISNEIKSIPKLSVDGNYGTRTEEAVRVFQRTFGLTATGTTDETTWLVLNYIYSAVYDGCLG